MLRHCDALRAPRMSWQGIYRFPEYEAGPLAGYSWRPCCLAEICSDSGLAYISSTRAMQLYLAHECCRDISNKWQCVSNRWQREMKRCACLLSRGVGSDSRLVYLFSITKAMRLLLSPCCPAVVNTGVVISMLCFLSFPPKMKLASSLKPVPA